MSVTPIQQAKGGGEDILPRLYDSLSKDFVVLETDEDHYKAARDLLPFLRENANKATQLRRMPDENVDAMITSGLLNCVRPKMYGGAERELSVVMNVISILAQGCVSTAWCWGVYQLHTIFAASLPKEGQDEIFGDKVPFLSPGIFNHIGSKARRVEGGFMLSGRWAYASASAHSNWASVAVEVTSEDGSPPEYFTMVIPRDEYNVHDDWYSVGMAGSGSGAISIPDEIFVPERRAVSVDDQKNGTTPGAGLHEAIVYSLPVTAAFHIGAAPPTLGAAKEAMRIYAEKTKKRVRAFTAANQADNPAAAVRLGNAAMELYAAELVVQNAIAELEERVRSGEVISMEVKSQARMVGGYVVNKCKNVVTSLMEASSASSMEVGAPLGRIFMDITTMSMHHTLDYDGGPQNYGRVLMGLEPLNQLL